MSLTDHPLKMGHSHRETTGAYDLMNDSR
jgi:hypothetical protein